MKFKHYIRTAAVAVIFGFGTAHAAIEGWTTDFEAAKKQAADEKKDLFLFFTGSDWCGYCIKLTKDVLSQDAFKDAVKDKFVLVELDFPRKPENISKLPEALIAQNEALQKTYAINKGFPTIYLTDAQGKPFAKTGFLPIGTKTYLKHLDELFATRETRESALAEAKDKEGEEKAKTLLFAINTMGLSDELISTFYAEELELIKSSSPDAAKKMEMQKSLMEFQGGLNALLSKNDHEGAIKFIDEKLAAGVFEGEIKQQTLIFKSMSFMKLNKPEDALKTLEEAKAIAPESRFAAQIESIKNRIEASAPK